METFEICGRFYEVTAAALDFCLVSFALRVALS